MRCASRAHDIREFLVHYRLARHDERSPGLENGAGDRKPPRVAYREDHRHPRRGVKAEKHFAHLVVSHEVGAAYADELGTSRRAARGEKKPEFRRRRLPFVCSAQPAHKLGVHRLGEHERHDAAVDAADEKRDGRKVLSVDDDLHRVRLEPRRSAIREFGELAICHFATLVDNGDAVSVKIEDRLHAILLTPDPRLLTPDS